MLVVVLLMLGASELSQLSVVQVVFFGAYRKG